MSTIAQKVGASAVNCSLILLMMLPLYPVLGLELWRIAVIGAFWVYNMVFRTRCIGMRVVGTYIPNHSSTLYVSLYTAGFSTFFYHVVFPLDLLLLNGIAQIWSITMTGNTLHANLAHQGTLTRPEYLKQCKLHATGLLVSGKPYAAVAYMVSEVGKHRQFEQPKWIYDLGYQLAREGNAVNIKAWIDGFN